MGSTVMDGTSGSRLRRLRGVILPATVAAAMFGGCSSYIGTTYQSFLKNAKENTDPNIRYVAYAKLGSLSIYENDSQKAEAVKMLAAKFEEGDEPIAVRAVIIRSLGNLRDRRARNVVAKAINDTDNAVIRVEACRALGKVGLPEDATTLARIMTIDKLEDCRIAAIEGIAFLKPNSPRIYGMLVDGMENDDPAIRFECLRALRATTSKDYGVQATAWRRELQPMLAAMSKSDGRPSAEASAAVSSAATPER
jgi:HEAT repeat protein